MIFSKTSLCNINWKSGLGFECDLLVWSKKIQPNNETLETQTKRLTQQRTILQSHAGTRQPPKWTRSRTQLPTKHFKLKQKNNGIQKQNNSHTSPKRIEIATDTIPTMRKHKDYTPKTCNAMKSQRGFEAPIKTYPENTNVLKRKTTRNHETQNAKQSARTPKQHNKP